MITVIDETTTNDDDDDDDDESGGNANDSASAGAVSARGGRPPSLTSTSTSTSTSTPPSPPPKLPGSAAGTGEPPPDNSDLMNRLRNFLPRMESANRALLSPPFGSLPDALPTGRDRPPEANHSIRLDTNLQLDDSDSDDTDDDATDGTTRTNPLIREVNGADDREPGDESPAEKSAKPTKHSLSEHECASESESATATATATATVAAAPTIQLQFGLGALSDNPLMKLLAGDDDDDDDDDNDSERGDQPHEPGRLRSVSELLRETSDARRQRNEQEQPPIRLGGSDAAEASRGTKSDGPKPWITELS